MIVIARKASAELFDRLARVGGLSSKGGQTRGVRAIMGMFTERSGNALCFRSGCHDLITGTA